MLALPPKDTRPRLIRGGQQVDERLGGVSGSAIRDGSTSVASIDSDTSMAIIDGRAVARHPYRGGRSRDANAQNSQRR